MDFHLDHQQSNICTKHTLPILIVNKDGYFCLTCLEKLPGNVSIEQFNQYQQKIIDKVIKQIDLDHQSFQELLDQLLKYKNAIILSLDKISQQIQDQIKRIKESKSKFSTIRQSNKDQKSMINEVELVSNKQQQFNKDAKDQIRKQLNSFQLQFAEINQLCRFLEDKSIAAQQQVNKMIQSKIQIKEVQIENAIQKFQYELIKESSMKTSTPCYSFAFNKDNTILAIGSFFQIIVYEFMDGNISKELQIICQSLNNYIICVCCLHFMKQSNSFVSSCYNQIIIWILDKDNKWIAQQYLEQHTKTVNCILMNKMEDQLISGSDDCSLKFWRRKTGSWICLQSISRKFIVQNVSLNEKEDKLIVCEKNDEYGQTTQKMFCIQILIQQNNEQWSLLQTIDIPEFVYRLSFTIGEQFVFATVNSGYLIVYDYDTDKRQFKAVSQIKIQNVKECDQSFPCQFIKSCNILTYKHGQFLNIIKVNQKQNYELIQTIEFDDIQMCGKMSDDAQYLVIENQKSKEIQISKIKHRSKLREYISFHNY